MAIVDVVTAIRAEPSAMRVRPGEPVAAIASPARSSTVERAAVLVWEIRPAMPRAAAVS
jgi:hypothetical protein